MPARIHAKPTPQVKSKLLEQGNKLQMFSYKSYLPTSHPIETHALSNPIDFDLMEVDGGYVLAEEGCRTPKGTGFRIPAICPPAPRKKQMYLTQRSPPENGYFQPPDLEILFSSPPLREACV